MSRWLCLFLSIVVLALAPAAVAAPRDDALTLRKQLQALQARVAALESKPAPAAGRDGRDGMNGAPGAPGATGLRGEVGPAGLTGPAGPRGADGAAGRDGTDGAPGRDGSIITGGIIFFTASRCPDGWASFPGEWAIWTRDGSGSITAYACTTP